MSSLQQRIRQLQEPEGKGLLKGIIRGIEKESLRVTREGSLAHTPHPTRLGAALTHPQITTDYSEALLEFITPPSESVTDVLQTLDNIHRYTYQHIGDELLWVNSMPCPIGTENDIPVAQFGSSNIGQMKTVYRLGLGHRYGRLMQTIAGIHYNFSMPDDFWVWLQKKEGSNASLKDFKTERYFGLIRNFRRFFVVLLYLFGAAPAACQSFVKGREHTLSPFGDQPQSLHAPFGTSLRMGDLGYQSQAQKSLQVCYNELDTYIKTLHGALTQSYPEYDAINLKNKDGSFRQLNANLLQIENEFYSTIRPKRNADMGEIPLHALKERGVEYIEVRCLDLNPFLPVAINAQQMHFLDTFLLFCLLQDSPKSDAKESQDIVENQHRIVYRGRDPKLTLRHNGIEKPVSELADELFNKLESVAELLDQHQQTDAHYNAYRELKAAIKKPELTPSSQILEEMRSSGKGYFQIGMEHSQQHREYFLDSPLAPEIAEEYQAMAKYSLEKQREIEAADSIPFDKFLTQYYQQYNHLIEK